MKYGVFISYSHKDAKLVSPIVQLIRSMRSDLVFQDTLSIKPGKPWESQLVDALQQSDVVIVFWCSHSKNSAEVKKEYEKAIKENKDVLPVLLDGSELPEEIAKYQWIDLRTVIQHKKSSLLKRIVLSLAIIIPIFFFFIVMMVDMGNQSVSDDQYQNLPSPQGSSNYDSNITAAPIDSLDPVYPDNGFGTLNNDNSPDNFVIWLLIILTGVVVAIPWWLIKRNKSKKKKQLTSTSLVADKLLQQLNDKLPRVSK